MIVEIRERCEVSSQARAVGKRMLNPAAGLVFFFFFCKGLLTMQDSLQNMRLRGRLTCPYQQVSSILVFLVIH